MVATYGVMHDVTSVKVKRDALEAMKGKEAQMASRIDALVRSGEIAVDEQDDAVQGCGGRVLCGLFGRRRSRSANVATAMATGTGERSARTGVDARLFGQRGKATTAADRLHHAAESVEAHVDQLGERARAARAKAKELFAAKKNGEAMAALKRAKALEKQLESASATHAALERQVDVLAESALQKEVASALSASVASTKKKTKGLMSKAEDAVDGATELKDFAEDIAQTLGNLQTETFDDDELLEELQAMQVGDELDLDADDDAGGKERSSSSSAMAALIVTPAAIAVGMDAPNYPKVPTRMPPSKAVERRKLLDDDGAEESHSAVVVAGDPR